MTRPEYSFERDFTFHLARRRFGRNIPATDIDFLEFDNLRPVLVWEAKSNQSKWRTGVRTASMVAQWRLATQANIEYRVVEHSHDWSQLCIVKVRGWYKMGYLWRPHIESEITMSLPEFLAWLYSVRDRDMMAELPHGMFFHTEVPSALKPVSLRYESG